MSDYNQTNFVEALQNNPFNVKCWCLTIKSNRIELSLNHPTNDLLTESQWLENENNSKMKFFTLVSVYKVTIKHFSHNP